jgi:hypothetical protein
MLLAQVGLGTAIDTLVRAERRPGAVATVS